MSHQCSSAALADVQSSDSWGDVVASIAQHIVERGHMQAMPQGIQQEIWADARRSFWHVEHAAAAVLHWLIKKGECRDCEATLQDDESFRIVLDDGEYEILIADVPAIIWDLVCDKDAMDALTGIPALGLEVPRGREALLGVASNMPPEKDSDLHAFYAHGLRSMRMASRMVLVLAKSCGFHWTVIPNRLRLPSGMMVGIVVQAGPAVLMVPREQIADFVSKFGNGEVNAADFERWKVEA